MSRVYLKNALAHWLDSYMQTRSNVRVSYLECMKNEKKKTSRLVLLVLIHLFLCSKPAFAQKILEQIVEVWF